MGLINSKYRVLLTRTRTTIEHAVVYVNSSDPCYIEKDARAAVSPSDWVEDRTTTMPIVVAHSEAL